jgi:hypothetical protein
VFGWFVVKKIGCPVVFEDLFYGVFTGNEFFHNMVAISGFFPRVTEAEKPHANWKPRPYSTG